MPERLSSEQAARLARRCMAADNAVAKAKARYEEHMAARAVVFLECFEAGLTIPEISVAAHRSPAMVSIALADARKAREGQQSSATA